MGWSGPEQGWVDGFLPPFLSDEELSSQGGFPGGLPGWDFTYRCGAGGGGCVSGFDPGRGS